jgi:hypothetical protein
VSNVNVILWQRYIVKRKNVLPRTGNPHVYIKIGDNLILFLLEFTMKYIYNVIVLGGRPQ